jgi:hypothetical protein
MTQGPMRRFRKADRDLPMRDEDFAPVASLVLMLGYIAFFATLWGVVYYFELLARR